MRPRRTRMVSNTPSPYCKPRSRASNRVPLRPLIHMLNAAPPAHAAGPRPWRASRPTPGRGANQDMQGAAGVAVHIADGPGIGSSPHAFELRDDFHAAPLGAPGHGAAGE